MSDILLILTREPREYAGKVRTMNLHDVEILAPETEEGIKEAAQKATIIFGSPPILCKYINDMPHLQWVQSDFAGIDALMKKGLRHDYLLTNVKDVYGEVMAEYVLGWILFFHRKADRYRQNQAKQLWTSEAHTLLSDVTVGIIGTGSIGKEIVHVLRGFNMHIIGMNRKGEQVDGFDDITSSDVPEKFYPHCDYIVTVVPNAPCTNNIICENTLSLMKQNSVLINIGRGNVIKDDDLVYALERKVIKAAVLDVFNEEPLPKNHPFWKVENCYITPHVSGHMVSDRVFEIFEENYRRFCAGKELLHRVDFEKGY